MDPKEFEDRLKRQTPRLAPSAWRNEVLASARARSPGLSGRPSRALWDTLRELLWPSPVAWGGLAAAWALLLALNVALGWPSEPSWGVDLATRRATPPPQVLAVLQEQRQVRAELREEVPDKPAKTRSRSRTDLQLINRA